MEEGTIEPIQKTGASSQIFDNLVFCGRLCRSKFNSPLIHKYGELLLYMCITITICRVVVSKIWRESKPFGVSIVLI